MMKDWTKVEVAREEKCDFCQDIGKDVVALYDGKIVMVQGPWAFMCEEHFKMHGVGLGLGVGQMLINKTSSGQYTKKRGEAHE